MKHTKNSKKKNINWTPQNISPHPPKSLINRWPEIILAISRTAKDQGRISWLTVSIKTINEINKKGVPIGIKWINIKLVVFNQPITITPNQKGNLKDRQKTKWEETEKT